MKKKYKSIAIFVRTQVCMQTSTSSYKESKKIKKKIQRQRSIKIKKGEKHKTCKAERKQKIFNKNYKIK